MEVRKAGNSNLNLSVLGLGTWAIGGGDWKFGWGQQNDSDSVASILGAIDRGINWIDTAAIYGEGHSEQVVGIALQQLRDAERPLVATKCGRVPTGDGEIGGCLRRDSVIAECEASLQRLNIDCIDLYQLHWPDPDDQIEEAWQALVDLRDQGKVRHIGVSNHSVPQMERLRSLATITTLQPPYSMFAAGVEESILPYCREYGIGVICYSPMAKGLLTGGFTAERAVSLPAGDHRRHDPRFQSPQLEINLRAVGELQRISDGLGWSMPQLALSWVLRRPEVTSAIVGVRRPDQLEEVVAAGQSTMSDDVIDAVAGILQTRELALRELGDIPKSRV
ncbi:MAG: aldo/keto reductase [Planctomycetaceae bacterium]|jgi:aryl-alcohol dehydrogenase-like predicted oxidoreductase